jgi:hypothetical protein
MAKAGRNTMKQSLAVGDCALLLFCGCGENKPVRDEAPPQPEMLDKLESDDPDTFLKGVDEAQDKYGKKS